MIFSWTRDFCHLHLRKGRRPAAVSEAHWLVALIPCKPWLHLAAANSFPAKSLKGYWSPTPGLCFVQLTKTTLVGPKYHHHTLLKIVLELHTSHFSLHNVKTPHCNSVSIPIGPQTLGLFFSCESSSLPVHSEVAIIQFKNSILQLKHYPSVIGPAILSIAKLKLSITLIKSTAPKTHIHMHTTHFFFFLF